MSALRNTLSLSIAALLVACSGEEPAAPAENVSEPASTAAAPTEQAASDTGQPELGSFGIDLSNQDPDTRPGDDFFRFANGLWLDSFELPADRSNYGSFTVLSDRSEQRVRSIIDDLSAMEPVAGTVEQKISDYFNSYMNTDALNGLGITPLRPGLNTLAEIDSRDALIHGFGRSQIDNTFSPFGFFVGADRSDPDRYQLNISVGGLGLPDRDYYLTDTPEFVEVRAEYVAHIQRVLDFADIPDSQAKAEAILALETQVAEHTWPRAQRRNRDLTYNPMSYDDFKAEYSGLDWDAYFAAAGVEEVTDLNVYYPSAMSPIIELVNTLAIEDWQSLMTYRLIVDSASVLSEEIDAEAFHFYSTVLNGVPQQRARGERGVLRVGSLNSLGEAVGQIYVQRHFPESAKQQMEDLVENLRSAIAQSIDEIAWMGEATKEEAHLKLQSFRPKIAYPDEWKDLSDIEISRDDLFGNVQNIREFNYAEQLSRIGAETDREEWGMTPQTVKAIMEAMTLRM